MEFSGVPTLGIGAGARSYAPGVHYCRCARAREARWWDLRISECARCSDNYYTPELPAAVIGRWYENVAAGASTAVCGVALSAAQVARRLLALALLTDQGCSRGEEYARDTHMHFPYGPPYDTRKPVCVT